VLDGELAVRCTRNPLSGVEFPPEGIGGDLHCRLASGRTGHHVTDGCEPRQVRKEAAVSTAVCVVVHSGECSEVLGLQAPVFDGGCTAGLFNTGY